MANDTITNIYSFSFASNHLLSIDLVHILPSKQTNYAVNTKPEYCCFINMVPGEGTDNNKTYNFQKKITMKFSLFELEGLHGVLHSNALSTGVAFSPYKKFASTQDAGQKTLTIWQTSNNKKFGDKEISVRTIFIQLQHGQNKITLTASPDQVYSLGSTAHQIFLKGHGLEFERISKANKIPKSNNYSNDNYKSEEKQSQPTGGFKAPEPDYNSNIDQTVSGLEGMFSGSGPF
jgi:hypothetical protein